MTCQTQCLGTSGGEVGPGIQTQLEQDVQGHRVAVPATRSDLERGVAGLDVDAGNRPRRLGATTRTYQRPSVPTPARWSRRTYQPVTSVRTLPPPL